MKQANVLPFCVPESWDAWGLYINLLDCFLDYLILLIKREANRFDVEAVVGNMIVLTQFISQVSKIESQEYCMFSFT
jgi:hypothetical protein